MNIFLYLIRFEQRGRQAGAQTCQTGAHGWLTPGQVLHRAGNAAFVQRCLKHRSKFRSADPFIFFGLYPIQKNRDWMDGQPALCPQMIDPSPEWVDTGDKADFCCSLVVTYIRIHQEDTLPPLFPVKALV
jgi:hypothetical protein